MDASQIEMYEYARGRIKQKKILFYHLILFIVGSIFLFIINRWIGFYEETNWHVWVNTAWLFLLIMHCVKVFIIDSFMNKNWEKEQINHLIAIQEKKIEQLKREVEKEN